MAEGVPTTTLRRGMVMARDLGVAPSEEAPVLAVAAGDMLHWASIWGGFFVALVACSILASLPVAFGASPGAYATSAIGITWTAITAIVGTFLGALLTGYLSGVYNRTCAALNGLVLGCFLVGLSVLGGAAGTVLGRAAGALPMAVFAPRQVGPTWGFIIAAILIVAAGLAGGLRGETMREDRIERHT